MAPSFGVISNGCDENICQEGVYWLTDNLPEPFNGEDENGRSKYLLAIDEGKGEEVAQAIETLIRPEKE